MTFFLKGLQSHIVVLKGVVDVCKVELVGNDLLVTGANLHF